MLLRFYASYLLLSRVIYDRVWNRKNYFEIVTFLKFERGTSRAGNLNANKNTNKHISVVAKCNITLNFPALDIPGSIGRMVGISKYFFLFRTLSYITLLLPINYNKYYVATFKFFRSRIKTFFEILTPLWDSSRHKMQECMNEFDWGLTHRFLR